ncbi:MAG: GYF domain-containing protein, partial [Nannocystaceae bacterium]
MKIECDKCGAKYSIADEKVRGKTFKIRCKKCSNVIIVRDKGEAEAESDAGGGGDEEAAAGWHLAVDGETVGPLSEQEVRDRFARGEIDRDTSVWQEGFDDWLLLGDVGAFSDLAAVAAAAPSASAEAPLGDLGGDDDDPFKGTGIGETDDYGAGEAAAAASASASAASSFGDSDFGAGASSSGPDADEDPSSPRVNQLSG